jgi:hypothetical protein
VPAKLFAAVLSDGQLPAAVQSAVSARQLGATVCIFERSMRVPAAQLADGIILRNGEWLHGDGVERQLATAPADWVMVLGAGETVRCDDPAKAHAELSRRVPGPLGVRVNGHQEIRLHPPTPAIGRAIGEPPATVVAGLRIDPAPAEAPIDPACDPHEITELRDHHRGEDIYVVASGPSMDFVDPEFFANKVSIGLNDTYDHFPTTYLVRKEAAGAQEALESGIPLIVSEHDRGNPLRARTLLRGSYFRFGHGFNLDGGPIDLDVVGTDRMVVSWSTITSAINVAAYMGAANIVLCGHDCGRLDGRSNYTGYHDGKFVEIPFDDDTYRNWLAQIEQQTITVRERIREVYGARIYSLNPFVNLGCEGHRYER